MSAIARSTGSADTRTGPVKGLSMSRIRTIAAVSSSDATAKLTATTALLGATFISGQVYEFTSFVKEGMGYTTNTASSSFYTLTGFHGVHVSIGILMLMSLFVMSLRGRLPQERSEIVEVVGLYWHFVDVVWIVIFTVVYLIP